MTTVLGAVPVIGTMAANAYVRYGYAINRATIVVYEVTTGEMVILGRGTAVEAQAALSRVEGGIGTWVSAMSQVGRGTLLAPYGYLRQLLKGTGSQGNHLNQSGAYTAITRELGACVELIGNAFRSGTEHNQFHAAMERFWDLFRREKGGTRAGELVSNQEYLQALREALGAVKDAATGVQKFTQRQIDALVKLAEKEQRGYGYHDGPQGLRPEVPKSTNAR
jgi:hypothetical protein